MVSIARKVAVRFPGVTLKGKVANTVTWLLTAFQRKIQQVPLIYR